MNEVLKQRNSQLVAHASAYLQTHGRFTSSALSRYEVVRGLRDANATAQLSRFATFGQNSLILPITNGILDRAADVWVAARKGGHPRSDADIIIAATALEHGLVLVTGNTPHFSWVPGLTLANWGGKHSANTIPWLRCRFQPQVYLPWQPRYGSTPLTTRPGPRPVVLGVSFAVEED